MNKEEKEHEHRYWPNSHHKSDTCIICGFYHEFKEHKDPNGEICKGKKEPQHPKCWHCDTCPYVVCAGED